MIDRRFQRLVNAILFFLLLVAAIYYNSTAMLAVPVVMVWLDLVGHVIDLQDRLEKLDSLYLDQRIQSLEAVHFVDQYQHPVSEKQLEEVWSAIYTDHIKLPSTYSASNTGQTSE